MRLNELQISTIEAYISKVCRWFKFPKLGDNWWEKEPEIVASLTNLFLVPRLNAWLESPQLCNKCGVIQVFLSFLLQLLYHNDDPLVKNLENELRCVLTILGDISWMIQDRFLSVMAEFESVANQAGVFLQHYLLFNGDDAPQDYLDKLLAAVLDGIESLEVTLKSCDLTTPKTCTVNSFLILDSLIDNFQDLLKQEDNHIAHHLHRRLIPLYSSINDNDILMRIGETAHQAQYLITASLVKDAPLWYVNTRLTDLNHNIELISLKVTKHHATKRVGGSFANILGGGNSLTRILELSFTLLKVSYHLMPHFLGLPMPHIQRKILDSVEDSYNHLPNHLKPCFLHLGSFKQGQELSVGNLKRFWTAEGFARGKKEKSAESVAEEYLVELIDRRLVIVAKTSLDGRGVKTCRVDDLLRNWCLKKIKEEHLHKLWNFESFAVSEKGHHGLGPSEVPATLSINQHVSSFYGDRLESSLYVRDMRLLRVLNFNYIEDGGRLFGVEYLVNLRFLVIGEMPTCIERLVNLEYLRVISSRRVYLLPVIEKLKRLRYIKASEVAYSKHWNSSCTNSLEYLSGLTIDKLKDEELLGCSPHLRKLKCTYEVVPSELNKKEYPNFDLSFRTQLHSLSLSFHIYERFKLHNFGFPPNITKLTLWGSRFTWEKMWIVGRLKNLEVLTLSTRAFDGERWETRFGEFQKLRVLKLERVSLSVWEVASFGYFQLQHLILKDCYNLKEIPRAIGYITKLELIHVTGKCTSTLVESAEKIKDKKWAMGNENFMLIIDTTDYAKEKGSSI